MDSTLSLLTLIQRPKKLMLRYLEMCSMPKTNLHTKSRTYSTPTGKVLSGTTKKLTSSNKSNKKRLMMHFPKVSPPSRARSHKEGSYSDKKSLRRSKSLNKPATRRERAFPRSLGTSKTESSNLKRPL